MAILKFIFNFMILHTQELLDNDDESSIKTPLDELPCQQLPSVIMHQPGANEIIKTNIQHVPPSLSYLSQVNELIVKKKPNLISCETQTDFLISNTSGVVVYYATEFATYFEKCFFRRARSLDIKIFDVYKNQVAQINRNLTCGFYCIPGCIDHVDITTPNGEPIGTIDEEYAFTSFRISIKDAYDNTLFRIIREGCKEYKCCTDFQFKIFDPSGTTEIGTIIKIFGTVYNSKYRIIFPDNPDITFRLLIISALFLVHYRYFEVKPLI